MSKFWKIFEKKNETKTPIRKNITELTAEERAEIEERAELGTPSREIADALGLDVNVIYNYKKSLKERQAAAALRPVDSTKEILAHKISQREILKEDLELQKLKLSLERERQQMEMDQIRFRQEFEDWKRDIVGDDKEEDNISIKDLFTLWSQSQNKKNNNGFGNMDESSAYTEQPHQFKPKNNTPASNPTIEDSQVTAGGDAEFIDMSDEEIKKIISSQDKKYIKIAKTLPDKLLFDKIADQFPTLSDQSIDRAIQILRTEY